MTTVPSSRDDQPDIWMCLLPALLAWAWLVVKASKMWTAMPDLSFGWLVPILCGFLLWEVWENQPPFVCRWGWRSGLVTFLGLGLFFIFQVYVAAIGVKPAGLAGLGMATMILVIGNLHYVYGPRRWLGMFFPFAFLLIALPVPSVIQTGITTTLQHYVAAVTVEILAIWGIPAQLGGNIIYLSTGPVGIDEACSGIRSLQSAMMATLFIGYLSLKGFWMRSFLLGVGVAVAVLGNLMRVFFLSYQGHHYGLEAIDTHHDSAGWSILIFTVAGVAFVAWALSQLQRRLNLLSREEL